MVNELNDFCSYGCGQKAITKFKNGKFCCSISKNKCPGQKLLNSKGNLGRKATEESKLKMSMSHKKMALDPNSFYYNEEYRKKRSEISKRRKWTDEERLLRKLNKPHYKVKKGKKIHTEESKLKISTKNKGRKVTDEIKKKISIKNKGKPKSQEAKNNMKLSAIKRCKDPNCHIYSKKLRELNRDRMINGMAAYMNSCNKSPSKPQVKLFDIIKKFFPSSILNYPILNLSADICIPEEMIIIEYGSSYWHQDKDRDNKRKNKLKKLGFTIIDYLDYFPKNDEVLKVISICIEEKNKWI